MDGDGVEIALLDGGAAGGEVRSVKDRHGGLAPVAAGDSTHADGGDGECVRRHVDSEVVVERAGLAIGRGRAIAGERGLLHSLRSQGFVLAAMAGEAGGGENRGSQGDLAAAAGYENAGVGKRVRTKPFESVRVTREYEVDAVP